MLAALLAAADTVSDNPNRTPFYILAALLIAAAIGLAVFGIRRHENFPGSDGAMRATIGLFLVLVAGTMITAVVTA